MVVRFIIGLIPPWAWAAIIALALASTYATGHRYGSAGVQVKWDKQRAEQTAAHDKALAESLAESTRRIAAAEEQSNEDRQKAQTLSRERDHAEAARVAADAAAVSLRQRAARIVASARPADPAVARLCAPATEAATVLANMLDRIDSIVGEAANLARDIGSYADAAGAAGSSCERRYEALK